MKKPKRGYTDAHGQRRPNCPPHWPFGALTEEQMRERVKMEVKMRNDALEKFRTPTQEKEYSS